MKIRWSSRANVMTKLCNYCVNHKIPLCSITRTDENNDIHVYPVGIRLTAIKLRIGRNAKSANSDCDYFDTRVLNQGLPQF